MSTTVHRIHRKSGQNIPGTEMLRSYRHECNRPCTRNARPPGKGNSSPALGWKKSVHCKPLMSCQHKHTHTHREGSMVNLFQTCAPHDKPFIPGGTRARSGHTNPTAPEKHPSTRGRGRKTKPYATPHQHHNQRATSHLCVENNAEKKRRGDDPVFYDRLKNVSSSAWETSCHPPSPSHRRNTDMDAPGPLPDSIILPEIAEKLAADLVLV